MTVIDSVLPTSFYDRPAAEVARDLLGAYLYASTGEEPITGLIVETEAYGGPEDLASHASFRQNGVVRAMWGPPGTLYVYKAFGVYPCFNVVTGPEGDPAAVLIRAISIEQPDTDDRSGSGPGRLGRRIELEIEHNGHDLTAPPFRIGPGSDTASCVRSGRRVGVRRGDGRNWRFAIADHPAVSRPRL